LGPREGGDIQNFFVLFQYTLDGLEVEAFEGSAIDGLQLHSVVLQAPLSTLERQGIVDSFEKLGNRGIVIERDIEDDSCVGQAVAANHQPQTKLIPLHCHLSQISGTFDLLLAHRGSTVGKESNLALPDGEIIIDALGALARRQRA